VQVQPYGEIALEEEQSDASRGIWEGENQGKIQLHQPFVLHPSHSEQPWWRRKAEDNDGYDRHVLR